MNWYLLPSCFGLGLTWFCQSEEDQQKKEELEKTDNKLLFNTVKKYNDNENKTKADWKSEFSEFFILKEKKDKFNISNSPNLSKEYISEMADTAIKESLANGQSLRWGAGAYTIASIRQSGILVSQ